MSVATVELAAITSNTEPFAYADKIFRHIWSIRIRLLFYKLTLLGKPREIRKKLESAWLDRLLPVGSGTDSSDSSK